MSAKYSAYDRAKRTAYRMVDNFGVIAEGGDLCRSSYRF
jgi:hypothetical protein